MRNLISIIAILLIIAGTAAAADYWHLSLGIRGSLVFPGERYSNAVGIGAMASFGDPESKFSTQLEFDNWKTTYDYKGSDPQFIGREFRYSGLGFGAFEKYRFFNQSSRYSPYAICGLGAYFLELKREEIVEIVGVQLMSKYIHSLFSGSAGLGVEANLSARITTFIEGRYVTFFKNNNEDSDLIQTYVGAKYHF